MASWFETFVLGSWRTLLDDGGARLMSFCWLFAGGFAQQNTRQMPARLEIPYQFTLPVLAEIEAMLNARLFFGAVWIDDPSSGFCEGLLIASAAVLSIKGDSGIRT